MAISNQKMDDDEEIKDMLGMNARQNAPKKVTRFEPQDIMSKAGGGRKNDREQYKEQMQQ